jgi:hypothetical protein
MWLWAAVTSMPFERSALMTGVDLVSGQNKIAGDRSLAIAGRLEADRCGEPQWPDGSHCHSIRGDRIAARHAELIDAAVGLPFDADDLIELRGRF